MADRIDDLTKRVETVEMKLDRLSASVDLRFEQVDQRFNAVDAALLEQRQYAEFAYSRLEAKMDAGFGKMDARFEQMDARFEQMDARFEQMDAGFGRVGRIERKLDQFIDVQLQTNQLVDRRLRALEEQRWPGQSQ